MTDFSAPLDITNYRRLVSDPAAFADDAKAASWLFLLRRQPFAAMDIGMSFERVQASVGASENIVSDPPVRFDLDLREAESTDRARSLPSPDAGRITPGHVPRRSSTCTPGCRRVQAPTRSSHTRTLADRAVRASADEGHAQWCDKVSKSTGRGSTSVAIGDESRCGRRAPYPRRTINRTRGGPS